MAVSKWKADPAHTEIRFNVRHLMITTVTGHFSEFDLEVETDGNDFMKASKILFTANIDSLTTNNTQRDAHLKSSDFFFAEKHRQLRFEGRYFKKQKSGLKLYGDLTIRGVTKPIEVDVEYGGIINDPWGNQRAGFTVDGKINRKDFDLMWDAVTEAGQIVVGHEINIHCTIELVKQTEKPAAAQEAKLKAEAL